MTCEQFLEALIEQSAPGSCSRANPRASAEAALARHASACSACASLLRADRLLRRDHTPAPRPVALPPLLASALRETKPVGTSRPRRQLSLLLGSCVACLVATLILAPRPDLSLSLGARLWLPLVALLASATAGLVLFRKRGADGLGLSALARWLWALAGFAGFHGLVVLETLIFPGAAFAGTAPRDCLLFGLLSGGALLAIALVLSRRTVLTGAAAAGALAGASTGYAALAVLLLHCPSQSALHLHVAHGLPLLLLIASGAWSGRRWLAV